MILSRYRGCQKTLSNIIYLDYKTIPNYHSVNSHSKHKSYHINIILTDRDKIVGNDAEAKNYLNLHPDIAFTPNCTSCLLAEQVPSP